MCVFSSHSFWASSSLDVPAGVTQEEGHTEFLIHLSAVRALIFLARRIQPFLSIVDRDVEFRVLTISSFFTRWAFFFFFFFSEKIPFAGIELAFQRVMQKVITWFTSELPGRMVVRKLTTTSYYNKKKRVYSTIDSDSSVFESDPKPRIT